MKADMMWGYLIHLSANMWGEPNSHMPTAPWRDVMDTDEEIWTKVIDFLPTAGINTVVIDVGDAILYETHPEISLPGAWPKEKLKKELDRMRAMGLTPLPKLNFSAGHDAWLKVYSRMLSTPQYYQVCEDLILEVAQLFDYPEYFHIGMDEEWCQNKENMIVVRPKWLWWDDINFLFRVCDKAGTRPWVWADPCWNDPDEYLTKMSKSVLQSNWYYHTIEKDKDGTYKKKEIETFIKLEKAGFDQVPACSAITRWYNAEQMIKMGKEEIAPERLKGFMTCPWVFTENKHYYALLNDAHRFGLAKQLWYPELCK